MRWRHDTLVSSSSDEILSHDGFRKIVGLGEHVVPLIIDEIKVRPDHLLAALVLITGEDPAPDSVKGDFQAMANSWISWYDRR